MLQLLCNVAARLSYMHEAGFVHRDLKPANVMWLPRENRWTIIDFGCAARIGAPAPLSFTLAYAAPEVVRAFDMGIDSIESNPVLDAWSLGVMAFELLTGSPAFRLVTDGRAKVCSFRILIITGTPTHGLFLHMCRWS
jgi:eukaryotic-like serine/threonine-protein kinase